MREKMLNDPYRKNNLPQKTNQFLNQQQNLNANLPPLPHEKALDWWSRLHPAPKWTIGCSTLLLVLLLCSSMAIAASATNSTMSSNTTNTMAHVKATATPVHVQKKQPVKKVAKIKTTPKSTVHQPQSTAKAQSNVSQPVVQPTQPPVVPTPTSAPIPTVAPTAPPANSAVNGNPWGYDFNPGAVIYSPDASFCTYFNCIKSFWRNTSGYVEECADYTYSHSGGRYGVCTDHGGPLRTLYSH